MAYKYIPRLQARRIFQRAFSDGSTIYTKHMEQQMTSRGIDTNDLLSVKDTGVILNEPERDIKTGDWKYTIKGADLEGQQLEIVFTILDENRIKLISGWRC